MRQLLLIILFVPGLCSTGFSQAEVQVYGSIKKIMHDNDTTEKVRLNLLGPIVNYYGLGAVAGLDGEILILNGDTYVTRVWKGFISTDKSTDVGAALLVLARVQQWDTVQVRRKLDSISELETYLDQEMKSEMAIPFMILSNDADIDWHVVSRPEDPGKPISHKELGEGGKYKGNALLLGFFSNNHEGIFTHQGQKTHIHFQSGDKLHAGHVDEIRINKGDKLLIPKYQEK